ncbi:MAG: hypothetical protein LKM39_13640 [Chiayiivirga sp.]|jgi:hypothetical protein|nr:hypothetical protein [Chiayiivirga sp.]
MFIVIHEARCYGPFRDGETKHFASTREGAQVMPLIVPRHPKDPQGRVQLTFVEDTAYRAKNDQIKVDSLLTLAANMQEFFLARREGRVLTVAEIHGLWKDLGSIHSAIESLMHYAEQVVVDPSEESVTALRKALWRNRDADDFDPHYRDRFW